MMLEFDPGFDPAVALVDVREKVDPMTSSPVISMAVACCPSYTLAIFCCGTSPVLSSLLLSTRLPISQPPERVMTGVSAEFAFPPSSCKRT